MDTPEARAARAAVPSRTRLHRLVGASAAAAVAVAAAIYALASTGPTGDVTAADATTSVLSEPAHADAERAHVDLVLDGWSMRILGDRTLYASVDGSRIPVRFQPATAADVAELKRATPGLVQNMVARLVTDDPALRCTTKGCTDSDGPVPMNLLLRPHDISGLGDSFRGYDIDHGLYVAQVPTGGSRGTIDLSADGLEPLSVAAGPVETDPEALQAPEPRAYNGYLRGRFGIGVGLGRVFSVDAHWVGTGQDPVRYVVREADDVTDGAVTALAAERPAGAATGGLAEPFAPAATWSDGHLTYATSPTTGCGPEALCVPGSVDVDVQRDVRDTARVCSPGGKRTGVVALHDTAVRVNLPAGTHQFGLGDGGRWGAGAPELVSGEQLVRFGVLGLYDGSGPVFRAAGGRVDAGRPAPITVDDALAGIRFAGEHWSRC